MLLRTPTACAVALGLALGAPLAASAQISQFYRPPAVTQQGTATTPLAGPGRVTVKVFVHKDGSVGDATVMKSTNRGDNATALEIAKSSHYRPGARDAKPIDAFYTYQLNFTGAKGGTSASVTGGGDTATGALGQARALVRAGKYDQAKPVIEAYLQGHPNDREGATLLGVANAFSGDAAAASAAFDRAGTIDPRYSALAAEAYDKLASAQIGKADDAAAAAAAKAIALAPQSATGYNLRGLAEYDAGNTTAAIADLTRAKDLLGTTDAKQTANITANLAGAYLKAGDETNALAQAQAALKLDPQNAVANGVVTNTYAARAIKLANAGQTAESVAAFEQAAQAVPSRAGQYLGYAAFVLAGAKSPDWTKVKAEADRALAADPNDARANYVEAIALANAGKRADAKPYLVKAKANVSGDAQLSASIDAALKQVSS